MPCWGGEGGQSAPEDAPQAVVHSRAPADKASSSLNQPTVGGLAEAPAPRSEPGASPAQQSSTEATPEELVRSALAAEAAGDNARRESLLREALKKAPDFAPARWHLGYVRSGKEWLTWEEVARRAATNPHLAEYRQRFETQSGTLPGELALARWCRSQGLDVQARFHWTNVLRFQPQHEEGLKALGMRWYQGRLVTHDVIAQVRDEQARQVKAVTEGNKGRLDWLKHWPPRLTRWQRVVGGGGDLGAAIRGELEAIRESSPNDFWAAVWALDSNLLTRSQLKKEEAFYRALSLDWIELLDAMPERQAAVSLAWLAVEHPLEEARNAAADALKKRPQETYVPILLARMQSPIEASVSASSSVGAVLFGCSFYREGAEADQAFEHTVAFRTSFPFFGRSADTNATGDAASAGEVRRWRLRCGAEASRVTAVGQTAAAAAAARIHQGVSSLNAAAAELNDRICAALNRATGVDAGAAPVAWWKWWDEQQCARYELDRSEKAKEKKRVVEAYSAQTYYSGGRPSPLFAPPPCCFPRGTKVWTLTGPVEVDKVQIGDHVLSQNPLTGELGFKAVVQTTTRSMPPSIKISARPATITAARGHAFLVAGEGWKMAKELKPGARLHTVSGAVTIARLEEIPVGKPWHERLTEDPNAEPADDLAYNLVVDDFHTYFVGAARLLAFDNLYAAYASLASQLASLPR